MSKDLQERREQTLWFHRGRVFQAEGSRKATARRGHCAWSRENQVETVRIPVKRSGVGGESRFY